MVPGCFSDYKPWHSQRWTELNETFGAIDALPDAVCMGSPSYIQHGDGFWKIITSHYTKALAIGHSPTNRSEAIVGDMKPRKLFEAYTLGE